MRISPIIKQNIINLRKTGLSHRQISQKLNISVGSALRYSNGIRLTTEQHLILKRNAYKNSLGKLDLKTKLRNSTLGGRHNPNKFQPKYSQIDLSRNFQDFYKNNGRIPTKREFVKLYRPAVRIFGTWNKAIISAGLSPNPVRFARKFIANDGHRCDSLAEKIIDDWMKARNITHEKNASYLNTRYTADFKVGDIFIEFFGLRGQLESYDRLKTSKLKLIKFNHLKFIPIFPEDIFPKSRLDTILKVLI